MHVPRVRSGLLTHQLDNQVLVYDRIGDRVHLLDPTSACVLSLLQEGGWTQEGLAIELGERLGVTADTGVLQLAIEELRAAGLLDETSVTITTPIDASRRDMLRKVVMAGAAAMLVPAITTLTATRGYAQTTNSVATCGACTQSSQCPPGGFCGSQGACNSNLQENGGPCTNDASCCSNNCSTGSNKICLP
jgi:hypothetical protein